MIPNQNNVYNNAFVDLVGQHHLVFNPVLKKLVTEESYQRYSGLFTGQDNPMIDRPLASIAFHPGDDLISGMYLDRWIKASITFKTYELMGVNIEDLKGMSVIEGLTVLYNCQSYSEDLQKEIQRLQDEDEQLRKK